MHKTLLRHKILLIFLGCALFLVLLEVGMRISGFTLKTIQNHRNQISLKKIGAYRILCLGESTTALGGNNSYPAQLENILNESNFGIKASVINMGWAGANTTTILYHLEDYLNQYKPDLVMTMMGINDLGHYVPYKDVKSEDELPFFEKTKIYKLARSLAMHIRHKFKNYASKPGNNFDTPKIINRNIKTGETISPSPEKELIYQGYHYQDQGDLPKAEELFKKSIELNPEGEGYVALGWCYVLTANFEQARKAFQESIKINPKNDQAYVGVGWIYKHLGEDYLLAEASFSKAIELNPNNEVAYIELGDLYQRQGKFNDALKVMKSIYKLNQKRELDYKSDRIIASLVTLYKECGFYQLSEKFARKSKIMRLNNYQETVRKNYVRLKEIVFKRGLKLICVQYPMRELASLKKLFNSEPGIIFVDNEKVFKDAIKRVRYSDYFSDMFAGDFGHCTPKGNRLLAQNIANTILREVFGKKMF